MLWTGRAHCQHQVAFLLSVSSRSMWYWHKYCCFLFFQALESLIRNAMSQTFTKFVWVIKHLPKWHFCTEKIKRVPINFIGLLTFVMSMFITFPRQNHEKITCTFFLFPAYNEKAKLSSALRDSELKLLNLDHSWLIYLLPCCCEIAMLFAYWYILPKIFMQSGNLACIGNTNWKKKVSYLEISLHLWKISFPCDLLCMWLAFIEIEPIPWVSLPSYTLFATWQFANLRHKQFVCMKILQMYG